MTRDPADPSPADAAHELAALRRAAERYRMIVGSAVDYGIIVTDPGGLITDWNEGARRVLGWSAAEVLGQPADLIFTPADRDAGRPSLEMATARAQGRASDERWHVRRDGSSFWASGEMVPLRAEDGALRGYIKILRDRTEQRLAAERQHADAQFLRAVLASSADCIKIADLDGRLVFMNSSGLRMMEIDDPAAIRGRPWSALWDAGSRPDVAAALAAAGRGEAGHFQGQMHLASGQVRVWDVLVTPICDEDGQPARVLSVSRDITGQKHGDRRRAALLELNERLRGGLDEPDAIAAAAAELVGRALEADRAGYATVEADGAAIHIRQDWAAPGADSAAGVHPAAAFGDTVLAMRRGEAVVVHTARADERPPATPFGAAAVIYKPWLEGGRPAAFFFAASHGARQWSGEEVAFVRNMAAHTRSAIERRRAEQALRELATSLEQRVEDRTHERDRLWATSEDLLALVEGTHLLRVSPSWTRHLGHAEAALLTRPWMALVHPDDAAFVRDKVDALRATGEPVRFENRVAAADGGWRWIAWSLVLEREHEHISAVGRDVTADHDAAAIREGLEERLRQSQKMEAVGQLTGGLAHDFNNLLASVSGSLELLQARIAQGRVGEVDRYVNAAQAATERAAALTHRLLAFSRRQTLDPKPTDVSRLVSGLVELIRRTVGPAVDVVPARAEPGLWHTLIDPGQLENALLNLCLNARDAMPEGGQIVIETGNVCLDAAAAQERDLPRGPYVLLAVSDSGTGMSAEVAAKAFDPFFTTKPIGHGTGLGLSMIYGFVRQSGGQARILSAPGRGTTVQLYLPRHTEAGGAGAGDAAPAEPELGEAPRAGPGESVLVVDDEPALRMLVTEVLEDLGYSAREAPDAAAGLAVLRSDARVDLLVTDVGLPGGMNGRQLADAARTIRPGLKVLFITGYAETAVLSHGDLGPGMHVLTKPFAMDALASRMRELLAGR